MEDRYSKANAAYEVLKRAIDEQFAHGRFVAIGGGKVVADAGSLDALRDRLAAVGLTWNDVAIDQACIKQEIEYLGWMTTEAMLGHWINCVLPPGK